MTSILLGHFWIVDHFKIRVSENCTSQLGGINCVLWKQERFAVFRKSMIGLWLRGLGGGGVPFTNRYILYNIIYPPQENQIKVHA